MTPITLENEIRFSKNVFQHRMGIPLYGLCVGIAKETEAMPDRPIHEQNRNFASGVCFQQHVSFQAAV